MKEGILRVSLYVIESATRISVEESRSPIWLSELTNGSGNEQLVEPTAVGE